MEYPRDKSFFFDDFNPLFKKVEKTSLPEVNAADSDIVAIADGELIDVHTVPDPMFAEEMMGTSTAFRFSGQTTLCSPANGKLSILFPTGHAFGVTTNEGVEILVHCGIDTVSAKRDGFRILGKKQGDQVKAGDPIVEADINKLEKSYDMSTILIITDPGDKEIAFIDPQPVKRGQSVLK